MHLVLLMPDHLHALASFPGDEEMTRVVGEWKKFTARKFGILWQRDLFDHRVRHEESLHNKEEYIRQNPVRKGCCPRGGLAICVDTQ